jgi:hypothetical protein
MQNHLVYKMDLKHNYNSFHVWLYQNLYHQQKQLLYILKYQLYKKVKMLNILIQNHHYIEQN